MYALLSALLSTTARVMTLRLAILPLLLLLAACASTPALDGQTEALEGFSSPESALNYHLTLGDIALNQRDYPAATDAYMAAMTLSDDPEVAEQATRLALHTERHPEAMRAARRWAALVEDDTRPYEGELVAALRSGDLASGHRLTASLLQMWGAPDESAFRSLGRLLLDEEDRAAVVELMLRVVRRYNVATAWEVTALAALRADDQDVARRAVARARVLDPESTQAAMLEARIMTLSGDEERGLALMHAVVEENPDDPSLRFTLAGLYLNLRRYDEARAILEQVVQQAPAYLDARWTLALLLLQQRDMDAAEPQFRALLADPVRRHDVPYYLGGVYELREDWQAAFEWFDEVEYGENRYTARVKAAQMLFRLGRFDEGRERLTLLRADQPAERLRLYRIEAELLMQAGKDAEAMAVFEETIEHFPEDPGLIYTRALAREQLGMLEGAIADLRRVNELLPDNAEAQNALGYVLADRGDASQWEEARALIERAVEQEPDNAAFIDSKGWVLYRLGELEQAREWLARSWELMKNPEVGAHLGEVLWKLGDRDSAEAIWAEAAAVDAEHAVLVETLRRLKQSE